MSSSTDVAAAPQLYFCHQCDRTINITPSPSVDLSCPLCHGGFIEEFDLPNPNPNPNPNPPFADPFSLLFSSPTASSPADIRSSNDFISFIAPYLSAPTVGVRSASGNPETESYNAATFLRNHLHALISDGANIQFVVDGGSGLGGGGPFFGGGNLGDYFVGPGLEQLIQQLAENDPNRYGTPPASKSAIESLPDITIQQAQMDSDEGAQCAVCKDEFEMGAKAKQMPCKHIYHKDCILPWLELHNSCPVCRFELPTDDSEYEQRARGGQEGEGRVAGSGDSVGVAAVVGAGNSPGARTVERRFRISLPWSLSLGFQAEPSNAGDGGNSGSSGGARGGGSGGQGNSGAEPRQEDLD